MNVNLVSIEKDGVIRLATNGSMTASEMAEGNQHPLAGVIGQQWSGNRVVLSMDQTQYIDSTAIGWLLSCQKQFQRDGGQLVLHSVPPSVQQIFDLLKVNRVLDVAGDEDQALEKVRDNGE